MIFETRNLAFTGVVVVAVAAFFALGVWQLGRHQDRSAADAEKRARRDLPRLELSDRVLSRPADSLDWRRARATGRFDYERELVLRSRVHDGIPGVYVVTPLVLESGRGLPVLRGWLPAADGFDAPLEGGRPAVDARDTAVTVEGLLVAPPPGELTGVDTVTSEGRAHPVVGQLNDAALEHLTGDAVPGLYLHGSSGGSTGRSGPRSGGLTLPRPVDMPTVEGGAHLTYAVQWFTFAAITLVGGGIFLGGRIRG
ncbi:MAG: SURF1 family protein [Gemmatimonadota bacterium]